MPPFTGHVLPAAAIARELASRGHAIAWVAAPSVHQFLPAGAKVYSAEEIPEGWLAEVAANSDRQLEAFRSFWLAAIIPLARAMVSSVEAAIADFDPACIIADQHAIAGPLAARLQGRPWVTLAPTGQPLTPFFELLPKVGQWLIDNLAELQRDAGLEPVQRPDQSPYLVFVFTTREFAPPGFDMPPQFRFIGPVIDDSRTESTEFPWEELSDKRRVFVSLGTISFHQSEKFFAKVIDAFADEPVQVILRAPPGLTLTYPENFIVRPWIPQLELLPKVNAVISHGGGSTVREALWFGIPLVVAPIAYDQTIWSDLVGQVGAGVRESFNRVTPERLWAATYKVLEEPSYREVCERIQKSFRASGGARLAADEIESIAPQAEASQRLRPRNGSN